MAWIFWANVKEHAALTEGERLRKDEVEITMRITKAQRVRDCVSQLVRIFNLRRRRAAWTIGLRDGSIITSEDCLLESIDPSMLLQSGDDTRTMRDHLLAEIHRRNLSDPKTHKCSQSNLESCPCSMQEMYVQKFGTMSSPSREDMKKFHPVLLMAAGVHAVRLLLCKSVHILSCYQRWLNSVIMKNETKNMSAPHGENSAANV